MTATDWKRMREEDGKLPYFALPGGYPLIYYTANGGELCSACANQENGSEAHEKHAERDWRLVGFDPYYEGPLIHCAHCNAEIESAYGDPRPH